MIRWLTLCAILVLGVWLGPAMPGTQVIATVDFYTTSLVWDWSPGARPNDGLAKTFVATCGPASGQYTYPAKEILMPSKTIRLQDVLPVEGPACCVVSAERGYGPNTSTELCFEVGEGEHVDTTPPMVMISSPASGAVVPRKKPLSILITAVDESALVSEVTLFVNRKSVEGCTLESPPFACVWTVPAPPGRTYTLQAQARDASGNMALSVPVRVTSERPDTRALPPAR